MTKCQMWWIPWNSGGQGISPDVKTSNTGNAMVGRRESTHQLDTLNNGGSAGTRMVFTAIGEFGQGPVSASRQPSFSKTDESFSQKEIVEQWLPRVCPDGQGGECGREV